ncbi:MAG: hypothetical protein AAF639_41530 [Chloroflexota bacterium]
MPFEIPLELLWYILAGFILGFTTSTLWEWLYFRGERMKLRDQRIAELESELNHQAYQQVYAQRESSTVPNPEQNGAESPLEESESQPVPRVNAKQPSANPAPFRGTRMFPEELLMNANSYPDTNVDAGVLLETERQTDDYNSTKDKPAQSPLY